MSEQNSNVPAVKVRLERILADINQQKGNSEAAAQAIALYTHVLAGLDGIVPEAQIHMVAATIAAGVSKPS